VRLFAARALSDLSDKGLPTEVIAAVQAFAADSGTVSKLVEVQHALVTTAPSW
jgi:hypothetical protein